MTTFFIGAVIGFFACMVCGWILSFFSPPVDEKTVAGWKREYISQMDGIRPSYLEELRLSHGEEFHDAFLAFLRDFYAGTGDTGDMSEKEEKPGIGAQKPLSGWKEAPGSGMRFRDQQSGKGEWNVETAQAKTKLDKWREGRA